MQSLLTWTWDCETNWEANSRIVSQFGYRCAWIIEMNGEGVFSVSEFINPILADGTPRPLPSFTTLAEAKEWCEKRENELLSERRSVAEGYFESVSQAYFG